MRLQRWEESQTVLVSERRGRGVSLVGPERAALTNRNRGCLLSYSGLPDAIGRYDEYQQVPW